MAGTRFEMDAKQVDSLMDAIKAFDGDAEKVINEEFESYGAPLVEESIQRILPVSGRTWKGKKAGAKSAKPFMHDMQNLGFIVRTKSAYDYLYFPDDGSNTRKRRGNQRFMIRGAEEATPKIVDRCLARLSEAL